MLTVSKALEILGERKRTLAESTESQRISRREVQYLLLGLDIKAEDILDNASAYSSGVISYISEHHDGEELDVQDMIASSFIDGLITGCLIRS